MVVATSRTDPHDEGYPRSTVADLDPGPTRANPSKKPISSRSHEHRVVPEHQRHDRTDNEDRFDDADDIDDAESGR